MHLFPQINFTKQYTLSVEELEQRLRNNKMALVEISKTTKSSSQLFQLQWKSGGKYDELGPLITFDVSENTRGSQIAGCFSPAIMMRNSLGLFYLATLGLLSLSVYCFMQSVDGSFYILSLALLFIVSNLCWHTFLMFRFRKVKSILLNKISQIELTRSVPL